LGHFAGLGETMSAAEALRNQPFQVAIVGGGILGCALARSLTRAEPGLRVALLEKETQFARHQSGRNSGVVHSGLYYRPDSMKARTCRAGREALEAYLRQHDLPYDRCGKVVVALDATEEEGLEALLVRGRDNGLSPRRLSRAELERREPALRAQAAILVEETGVTDYARVAAAFAAEAEAAGAQIHLGARVTGFSARDQERGGVRELRFQGGEGGPQSLRAEVVVICAGLFGDRLARAAGLEFDLRIVPFRGEYYQLCGGAADLCRGLIYPVPDPRFPFLGVHLTRDVYGGVEAGPNAVPALAREGYRWRDFSWRDLAETLRYPGFHRLARRHLRMAGAEIHRSLSRRAFARSLRRMVPEIRDEDLRPAPAGVRAQALDREGRLLDDFAIAEGPGLVAVLNAPSPAATASLAIAEEVRTRVLGRL
jgi:(S)-2-hydroxyglutarate dehydrogenase